MKIPAIASFPKSRPFEGLVRSLKGRLTRKVYDLELKPWFFLLNFDLWLSEVNPIPKAWEID
jgi:hypothetical protein